MARRSVCYFLFLLRGREGTVTGTKTGSHILEEYLGWRTLWSRGLGLEYLTVKVRQVERGRAVTCSICTPGCRDL